MNWLKLIWTDFLDSNVTAAEFLNSFDAPNVRSFTQIPPKVEYGRSFKKCANGASITTKNNDKKGITPERWELYLLFIVWTHAFDYITKRFT